MCGIRTTIQDSIKCTRSKICPNSFRIPFYSLQCKASDSFQISYKITQFYNSLYIYSNHFFHHSNKLTNSLLIHTPKSFFFWFIIHIPNMGSNSFNFLYVNRPSNPSHVLTFHSTAKWNAHFAAFKETDKLVCFCNYHL